VLALSASLRGQPPMGFLIGVTVFFGELKVG